MKRLLVTACRLDTFCERLEFWWCVLLVAGKWVDQGGTHVEDRVIKTTTASGEVIVLEDVASAAPPGGLLERVELRLGHGLGVFGGAVDGEADEDVGGGFAVGVAVTADEVDRLGGVLWRVDEVLDTAFEGWVETVAFLASEPDVLTRSGRHD